MTSFATERGIVSARSRGGEPWGDEPRWMVKLLPTAARRATMPRGSDGMDPIGLATSEADTASVEVYLLGGLTVRCGGEVRTLPPSRKTRALLAYLAANDRPVRRERLCELFWEVPDDPRGALRWSLSRLRQVVGDVIDATRETVTLRRDRVITDLAAVRAVDPDRVATADLEAAVGRFRGDFIEDLALPRCPEYEAWRTAHLQETQVVRLRLLRALVDRLRDEPERALPFASTLSALDPEDKALAEEAAALAEAGRKRVAAPVPLANDDGAPPKASLSAAAPAAPPLPPQEIRYVAGAGGVQLAYAVAGSGYPLLKCANWMSDLQYDWESSVWSALDPRPVEEEHAHPLRSARQRPVRPPGR